MSPPPQILIIGCGIAGPVLALLLKRKGFTPLILEKVHQLGDIGGSIMLMPNGLKILSLIGLSSLATETAPNLSCIQDISSDGSVLGGTELPSTWRGKYGQPACGIKRTTLNLALKEKCLQEGITVLEGWKVSDIEENKEGATAISSSGRRESGIFLIGCDGIKSATRNLVLRTHGKKEGDATFTGLTQAGGMSLTPEILKGKAGMRNWYGDGAHFIAYPISDNMSSWAVTQRSTVEEVESWEQMSESQLTTLKKKLSEVLGDWCEPIGELIEGTNKMIRYGLYDRPELSPEEWVSKGGRCVLVGDAAHATSPHLGQGANQALEDCWHLSMMFPDASEVGIGEEAGRRLKEVFLEFAAMRQPRTATLVKGARAQGERRVVSGEDGCRARDEVLRRVWEDKKSVEERWDGLLKEPLQL